MISLEIGVKGIAIGSKVWRPWLHPEFSEYGSEEEFCRYLRAK